jgi:predicted nucleic acid-binding protein
MLPLQMELFGSRCIALDSGTSRLRVRSIKGQGSSRFSADGGKASRPNYCASWRCCTQGCARAAGNCPSKTWMRHSGPFVAATSSAEVLDTSFLTHALIPSQATPDAMRELERLSASGSELRVAAVVFSEFPSVLRKLENQNKLAREDAQQLFDIFRRLNLTSVNSSPRLLQRSWSLSIQLQQSDTFDSMGYAVAEAAGADLWLSDDRFNRAATRRKLPHLRYVP